MPTADELLGASVVRELIDCLAVAAPGQEPVELRRVADSLDGQTLSERARAVRDALLTDLPGGYLPFVAIVDRALNQAGFTGWMIWPVTEALAVLSVEADELEGGLELLARLTPRLTGEFAIRTFLDSDLDRTLTVVHTWTKHHDEHVRRLASEGTRPRLPWARRVPAIMERPALEVLDALYRDPSPYVRRSVANHLNDISRADPELVAATARRWLADPDDNTASLVRHALRTLVKAGDPEALLLLGFGPPADVEVGELRLGGTAVPEGGELRFDATVRNHGTQAVTLVIDYVVHHRKANATLAPKVFKLATRTLDPGAEVTVGKTHSFRPISTRRYYPGEHAIELQVNGVRYGRCTFELDGTR
ncbi:DNA alkylation repair protein [Pseudonocardia spinosispora]|uniref:DNA alkylation repair protein n=1 Tax=Pseudonocardia spinosispora TaxID=103441 RepID=UPI0004047A47|nr:DNA alkylation repair protein [Pseudonocardia spinosispora]